MRTLSFLFCSLFLCASVYADSAATLTCTGKTIILTEISPYLGEGSPNSQRLFILKARDYGTLNYYSAFFLDVKEVKNNSSVVIAGTNNQGGQFLLKTNLPVQDDGPVIHEHSKGFLNFDHGPLHGHEAVECEKE